MQTNLADFIRDTPEGREADAILRKCVHCGFCTATCPTYQLLGDEQDSPRGRIYLIKEALEGGEVTRTTQLHLDRCLTCRACETTCPSGVEYGRLADIGRKVVEDRVSRSAWQSFQRAALSAVLPRTWLFAGLLALGRAVRPLLPAPLRDNVPESGEQAGAWPSPRHARKMLVLAGCVQPALAPAINAAAARVLDRLGIPYAVMGGLAVRVYAIPRFTNDVDLTISLDREKLPARLLDQGLGLRRVFLQVRLELLDVDLGDDEDRLGLGARVLHPQRAQDEPGCNCQ